MTTAQKRSHGIDITALNRDDKSQQDEILETCIKIENLDLFYGDKQALHNVNMEMLRKKVTAYIGPSGCGKSTLLRCINRMNDLVDGVTIKGKILLDNEDIYEKSVNVAALRRRVGMVFKSQILSLKPFTKT